MLMEKASLHSHILIHLSWTQSLFAVRLVATCKVPTLTRLRLKLLALKLNQSLRHVFLLFPYNPQLQKKDTQNDAFVFIQQQLSFCHNWLCNKWTVTIWLPANTVNTQVWKIIKWQKCSPAVLTHAHNGQTHTHAPSLHASTQRHKKPGSGSDRM